MIDVLQSHQWRSYTDLQQVHRLPFARRYCATVLPTWIERSGERSSSIAYDCASVPERHRRFMKRTHSCESSDQLGSPHPAVINMSSDMVFLDCAYIAHHDSRQPLLPTGERRHHATATPRLQPATVALTSTLQAMPQVFRGQHITHDGVHKPLDQRRLRQSLFRHPSSFSRPSAVSSDASCLEPSPYTHTRTKAWIYITAYLPDMTRTHTHV